MDNKNKTPKACTIYLNRSENGADELDVDLNIIEKKVEELNEMGIDITLEDIGHLIESKFYGYPSSPDLRRWETGEKKGKLLFPKYTIIRYLKNTATHA